ncbi:hypothetical protein D9758_018655 [Tetrapyrgos nigripes]|uniref:Uncharacterized protein n=1 Tax=Tetrapyrgos nigripes TaxID=182062 RepID=A0A8H5B9U4_9AGAR|nr:hypothetical protein D9758_018655 [Tetrapyrgos nigripes]
MHLLDTKLFYSDRVLVFKGIITPSFLTALYVHNYVFTSWKLKVLGFTADGDLFDHQLFLEMVKSRRQIPKEYFAFDPLVVSVLPLPFVKILVLGRTIREDVEQGLRVLE